MYDGSKGTNQKFTIPNRSVDNRYLKVRVQNSTSDSTGFGTPWTKATNYAGLTSGSNSYFLEESTDGLFEIYFGDGIIGNKPNHGNVITVVITTLMALLQMGLVETMLKLEEDHLHLNQCNC